MNGRVLGQGEMRSRRIVVVGVSAQHAAEMALAEHENMIETVAAERADQALDVAVLPGRARRGRVIADAHAANAALHDLAIDRVAVAQQKARRFAPGKGVGDLPRDPLRRRVRRDAEGQKPPSLVAEEDEHVEEAKADGRQRVGKLLATFSAADCASLLANSGYGSCRNPR
jgi:hypothetical protein